MTESVCDYFITPLCTECKFYEVCKQHLEDIAKAAGTPVDHIKNFMSSGAGVCGDFERKRL